MDRNARFRELAGRALAPMGWRWPWAGTLARVSCWLGVALTLVGSIATWGALAVGLGLLLVALLLAVLDEIVVALTTTTPSPPEEETEE